MSISKNNFPAPTQNNEQLSQTLTQIAIDAALSVGDMLVDAFGGGVSATEKAGFFDLVTEYDRKSEQIISDFIFQHYPDSSIVGEEGGARGEGAVRWFIDPIDGTSNFATGLPFFCVSIGAEYNGEILAGAVYDPIRREMFSASTGGAFLNGSPIWARAATTDNRALLLTDFPVPGIDTQEKDFLLFGKMSQQFRSVRRMGAAALELSYVACGRADVALASIISSWDVAAAYLLVIQAGGNYVPVNSNLVDAGSKPWLVPGYIAHAPGFELERSILAKFL